MYMYKHILDTAIVYLYLLRQEESNFSFYLLHIYIEYENRFQCDHRRFVSIKCFFFTYPISCVVFTSLLSPFRAKSRTIRLIQPVVNFHHPM